MIPIHSPFQSRHDVRSPQFIHMNPRKIVPVVVQSYFCPGQSTFSILFCSSNPKAVIFIAINGVIIPGWLTSTVVFPPVVPGCVSAASQGHNEAPGAPLLAGVQRFVEVHPVNLSLRCLFPIWSRSYRYGYGKVVVYYIYNIMYN